MRPDDFKVSDFPFADSVDEGDARSCERDGFTFTARIYRDDCSDRPDERDDGFWPSRDPKAAGYVEPAHFDTEQAKAEARMAAWERNEWFFIGIAVTAERAGVQLVGRYECALWGIESDCGEYIAQVAAELAGEARSVAQEKLNELRA
jgi:hypothetical protein